MVAHVLARCGPKAEHRFYVGMAIAIAAAVFAGFARSLLLAAAVCQLRGTPNAARRLVLCSWNHFHFLGRAFPCASWAARRATTWSVSPDGAGRTPTDFGSHRHVDFQIVSGDQSLIINHLRCLAARSKLTAASRLHTDSRVLFIHTQKATRTILGSRRLMGRSCPSPTP